MRFLYVFIAFCLLFLAVQPASGQVLNPHLNDTWVLDLATNAWTELSFDGTIPSPRRYAQYAYDSKRNRLVIFGGEGDYVQYNPETWALDLTLGAEQWVQLPDGPVALGFRGAAYDSTRDNFVTFYGMTLCTLDLSTNTWYTSSTTGISPEPSACTSSSFIYDAANDRFVLFAGGWSSPWSNRVRVLDPNTLTWSDLSLSNPPTPRTLTSAVYDPALQRMLVFGGVLYGAAVNYGDTWQLSLVPGSEQWTELFPGVSPLARGQHTAAFDTKRGRKIIFSGLHYMPSGFAAMNDVWAFDGADWNNLFPSGTRPITRRGAHSCYDAVNDRYVMFGGQHLPGYELSLDAMVDINPDTLNLKSKGQWMTCYITLPEGYDVNTIDVSTVGIVRINQDYITPPLLVDQDFGGQVGDHDEDGVADLAVKFDRQVLINLPLLIGDAGITVEGQLTTGEEFAGGDKIRVIRRGK